MFPPTDIWRPPRDPSQTLQTLNSDSWFLGSQGEHLGMWENSGRLGNPRWQCRSSWRTSARNGERGTKFLSGESLSFECCSVFSACFTVLWTPLKKGCSPATFGSRQLMCRISFPTHARTGFQDLGWSWPSTRQGQWGVNNYPAHTACRSRGSSPTAITAEASPWFESSHSPNPTFDEDAGPGPLAK